MGMRSKSKATSWEYNGKRGKMYSKKYANKSERRKVKRIVKDYLYYDYN